MLKKITLFFFLVLTLMSNNFQYSQTIGDFSNTDFLELSSSEIDLLIRRASAQGLTQFDLLKIAKSKGYSDSDIDKLDKKFKSAQNKSYVAQNASTPLEDTRMRQRWEEEMEVYREMKSDIYGYEVFTGNTFLSFQSNLNIPTPKDYVLGPGDKLFIDILFLKT